MSFDTADAAREAICCVRDDGLTLTDVAIESRRAVRDTRDLLERIEPELRDVVLSASIDRARRARRRGIAPRSRVCR